MITVRRQEHRPEDFNAQILLAHDMKNVCLKLSAMWRRKARDFERREREAVNKQFGKIKIF